MLIGITGQIGAGKTTAANVLKKMGAVVIDADKIGRAVVETNPQLLRKLTKSFGNQILTASGNLRRKKLAEVAFANRKNRKLLNKLVHPYLLRELRQELMKALRKNSVVVVDAALLLDWNLDELMDQTLVISCGKDKRVARLVKRGIAESDALARMKNQLPFSEYQNRANRVILNNSTKSSFQRKVREWGRESF
jgi:dephospho-CoA kinase